MTNKARELNPSALEEVMQAAACRKDMPFLEAAYNLYTQLHIYRQSWAHNGDLGCNPSEGQPHLLVCSHHPWHNWVSVMPSVWSLPSKDFPTRSRPFHSTPQKPSWCFFPHQPVLALNHRLPYRAVESFLVCIVCLLRNRGSLKGGNCSCSRPLLFPTSLSTWLKYKVATQ